MAEPVSGSEQSVAGNLPEAWQHVRAAGKELRQGLASILPPEFHAHGKSAKREVLLAARSVIDAALSHIDKHPV
jgi:hypothetical protein